MRVSSRLAQWMPNMHSSECYEADTASWHTHLLSNHIQLYIGEKPRLIYISLNPLLRFMELLLLLISMTSIVLGSQYSCNDLTTLAFAQSIQRWLFDTWTTMLLLGSLFHTARLCSPIQTMRVLFDSPM